MVDLKQFQTKTKTSNIVFKRKLEEKKKNENLLSQLIKNWIVFHPRFAKNKNCYKSAG